MGIAMISMSFIDSSMSFKWSKASLGIELYNFQHVCHRVPTQHQAQLKRTSRGSDLRSQSSGSGLERSLKSLEMECRLLDSRQRLQNIEAQLQKGLRSVSDHHDPRLSCMGPGPAWLPEQLVTTFADPIQAFPKEEETTNSEVCLML